MKRNLAELVRDVPDFPVTGILFKDITTLIRDGEAFQQVVDAILEHYLGQKIDMVVAIEARGFIFGAPLAYELGAGLVPVRKPGKLPAKKIQAEYKLEYGTNVLEMHEDALQPGDKVLVVDDLLATGGTAKATAELIEKVGAEAIGFAFLIELLFLKGREKIKGYDIFSLIQY